MQIENVLARELANINKKSIEVINERAETIKNLLERNLGKIFIKLFVKSELFVKLFKFFNKNFFKYELSFERLEPVNNEIWREKICLIKKNKVIDNITFVVENGN